MIVEALAAANAWESGMSTFAAANALQLCHSPRVELFCFMPTEISIPDAQELKSRVRELRRFL